MSNRKFCQNEIIIMIFQFPDANYFHEGWLTLCPLPDVPGHPQNFAWLLMRLGQDLIGPTFWTAVAAGAVEEEREEARAEWRGPYWPSWAWLSGSTATGNSNTSSITWLASCRTPSRQQLLPSG